MMNDELEDDCSCVRRRYHEDPHLRELIDSRRDLVAAGLVEKTSATRPCSKCGEPSVIWQITAKGAKEVEKMQKLNREAQDQLMDELLKGV
jgi:hypothetical protein